MIYFVEVVVPLAVSATFTYSVSEAEFEFVRAGMRVAVPFGKNKVYTALVLEKHHRVPLQYQAKEIHEILDTYPIATEKQIQLWKWISEYYMCSLGEVYRTAMPSRLLLESETLIHFNAQSDIDSAVLSDLEYLVFEALQFQSTLKIEEIVSILNKKTVFPVINSLLDKGVIYLQEELIEKYKPKQTRYVRLVSDYESGEQLNALLELLSRAAKQRELILSYFQLKAVEKKPVSVKQLLEYSGSTSSVIKALVDKEILEEYFLTEDRVIFKDSDAVNFELSDAQQKAYHEINEQLNSKDVVLLHGVTASGKTEIYIKMIESFILSGKQVLFLLPEIALTTQLVTRLVAYFGNQVAVFHSKYSHNERVEVWNQVLLESATARIVIGTRSALFLPFEQLGFVVIDEEHEATFKQQDPAPRYHGRDAAIVLAKLHGAKVLLGSATPSLESYYNAEQGKFGLVTLTERYANVILPEIILIDVKEKYKRKLMTGHFSNTLLEEMAQALALGEQVILFQNRRGFSPVVECMTCGTVPQCTDCDVSLTYHKYKNQLRCHYCGFSMQMPTSCIACNSVDLNTKGFGTEQVEEELKQLFPEKKIARMDQDTTRGKYGFEKLLEAFKEGEINILVGTQMLAKGLHFDNVNLVGVMNADNSLFHPDFRAHERAFQMLMQVSGRAGRTHKQGRVVIQTYNPYHNIIQQVTNNDYLGMYKEQMYERHNFKYPPFYRLVRLTLRHREFDKLKEASFWMYNVLKTQLDMPVLGPEEPAISRIRNQYIRVILIKIPQQKPLMPTKKHIQRILKSFEAVGGYRAVKVTANVDFY
ncbi:primosomal protein N' [Flavobacterium sp. NKUCC04_CG]|uniref:replication restart helicase PriA n=1 Tax=Flavobacterium sp. NKUCC04_CG TaxID=2842121 RepID=UPI001C5B8694|nr:primosomal protein N' [Flavobacterium sp. NKUCC04_CG]MBW3519300.1 primosomal protein N' [Flavobacterium sp. NKUCC04_CG]